MEGRGRELVHRRVRVAAGRHVRPRDSGKFRKSGQDTSAGAAATTSNSDVTRKHSHWRVIMRRTVLPGVAEPSGFDANSRVLRLESIAQHAAAVFIG